MSEPAASERNVGFSTPYFLAELQALDARRPQLALGLFPDAVEVVTEGTCPHCGNSDPDYFFDNPQDEYAWCYGCRRHSLNPRYERKTVMAFLCPQCGATAFEKRGEQRTYHALDAALGDDSWSTGEITMDTSDVAPHEEIIYCTECDSEFTESQLRSASAQKSAERADRRRQIAVEAATATYASDDVQVGAEAESVDGGYWVTASVWVAAWDVEDRLNATEAVT